MACDVNEMTVVVPARDRLDSPGVGSAEEDLLIRVGLGGAKCEISIAMRICGAAPVAEQPLGVLSVGYVAMASSPTVTMDTQAFDGAYGPVGRSAWMDIDWREHQRWVDVGGRPMNVIDLGEGPPIVFIHGLSGCWQNWLLQLPEFAALGHRVIALDLPGFGHSPMPLQRISISGYARDVDECLAELGVDSATVVGNSMGGFIGAELAIAFPSCVERLVLVSAAGLSSQTMRNERGLAFMRRTENLIAFYSGWLATRSNVVARRPRGRKLVMAIVARHPDRLPAALTAEQIRGSGKPGFVDAVDALTDYPIRHRLGEISCPCLIVWGTHDRLVPVHDAAEFERLTPGSRKIVFDDTGHVPMLERPARFNAALEEFLGE